MILVSIIAMYLRKCGNQERDGIKILYILESIEESPLVKKEIYL